MVPQGLENYIGTVGSPSYFGTGTRLNSNTAFLRYLLSRTGSTNMALASQLDHPRDHNPSNKCLTHKRLAHGQLRSSYRRPALAITYSTSPPNGHFQSQHTSAHVTFHENEKSKFVKLVKNATKNAESLSIVPVITRLYPSQLFLQKSVKNTKSEPRLSAHVFSVQKFCFFNSKNNTLHK